MLDAIAAAGSVVGGVVVEVDVVATAFAARVSLESTSMDFGRVSLAANMPFLAPEPLVDDDDDEGTPKLSMALSRDFVR